MLDCIDHMLRFRKEYYRNLEPVCKRWNLTRNELDVVLFLTNHPEVDRASEIVSRRGIAKSHVSQSVAALEQRGFLLRRPDARDRRTVHLELTDAARPMVEDAISTQRRCFQELVSCLTPEDLANWNTIAQKLLGAIERMEQNKIGKEGFSDGEIQSK